jgi:DNA-binding response OmpR family regulator
MQNIMIVEDDDELLELYTQEFSAEGYSVIPINNGRDVLAKINDLNPALLILDIPMRDFDGFELLDQIRRVSFKLPVILNSVFSAIKDNFKSWLADECIIKSSDLTELKLAIRKYALL